MFRSPRAPLVFGVALAALAATCGDEAGTAPEPGDPTSPPAAGVPVVQNGVEYRADMAIMESFPVQLGVTVTITNRGSSEAELTFPDGCVALLRAYRGGERVWDQSSEVGCTMALVGMTLAPGGSREVRAPTVSGYEILDESLPDGDYEIRAYLRPEWGEIEVTAGTAPLAIPRD